MRLLTEAYSKLDEIKREKVRSLDPCDFDEVAFRKQLSSNDTESAFNAITEAWQRGASLEQIALAMTMLCVQRMRRNCDGGGIEWCNLRNELMAVANIRKLCVLDETVAIKSAYHAAWLIVFNGDKSLADAPAEPFVETNSDPNEAITSIVRSIKKGNKSDAIAYTNGYIAGSHDGRELLRRVFLEVGSDYTYAGQRCMIEAWHAAEHHSERSQILTATVGSEADYRK